MTIEDLIASAGGRLTPTDRRIAEAVTSDPALMAFGTVADVAEQAGTSPPSIVRFAGRLGFDGFRDLQGHVREGLSSRLGRPSERIRQPDEALPPTRAGLLAALEAVFASLPSDRLDALAGAIAGARCVWILSGETAMAGAHTLASGLTMLRPDVTLVEEHAAGRTLSSAEPHDVAIVIDFPRYRRMSVVAARALADRGVHLVAITDGPLSPLAALTDDWCGLDIPPVGPFDSSVPAVAAAELIVARVARHLGDGARAHIDRVEDLWAANETFLDEAAG